MTYRPVRRSPPAPGAVDVGARTTNAAERLHEEFKRPVKTQAVLPSAETAAMPFRALAASGQIAMCKADGRQTLGEKLTHPVLLDPAA